MFNKSVNDTGQVPHYYNHTTAAQLSLIMSFENYFDVEGSRNGFHNVKRKFHILL